MGIARQHGSRQATTRGHSAHQEWAHKFLCSQGWEFDRQTSKTGNVYKHSDGRIVSVDATPMSHTNARNHLRQAITLREGIEVATTTPSPTAPLVAMADPFLLKEPTSREGARARYAASVGWIKRVLERHAPVASPLLFKAGAEIGLSKYTLEKARIDAGAVAFKQAGVVMVCLEHQLPEGSSRVGRARKDPELGVQHEAAEHPIGGNNGDGPEPREEPARALEPSGIPGLNKLPPDWVGPGQPVSQSGRVVDMSQVAPFAGDGDVSAAAQLLLSSLGLKVMDPRVQECVRRAESHNQRATEELTLMKTALREALRLVVE